MRSFFHLGVTLSLLLLAVPGAKANHATIEVDGEFKDNFEDTEAVQTDSPTDLEFTPDGKYLFVTEKEGNVWVIDVEEMDKGDAKAKLAFKIPHPMCFNGARGLLGIGIHPDYPVNRWVYLFFNYDKYDDCAADDGPVNRLARFNLCEDNMIDEIAFGKDGYLYITVGDGGSRNRFNDDDVSWPQALDRLFGKVLRFTDTGDIPEDNPFTPAMGETNSERCKDGVASKSKIKCQEIYATGLRNPYRFAMDPNAEGTKFFINEVGRQQWERILPGGDNYAGANYGFPFRQGPCEAGTKIGEYKGCGPSEFVDPVHWYEHDEEDGGAVTGGAFVPDGIGWPESFKNAYLYAEYAYGGIYRISPGGKGCPYPECDPPISDFMPTKKTFSATKKVVSMQFGPHKGGTALYYITRGDTGNRGETGVFRIAYTGSANRGPKAHARAEPSVGFAPLAVAFDATESIDPDGDSLSYEWDFNGDGVVDSTEAKPSFVYTESGTHVATLTVKDGNGGTSTDEVRIDADNTPPIPKIESPAEGSTFAVGDVFTLVGSATDKEDGKLSDMQLTWEVRQHHNTHYHPFLDPTQGNNFDLWPAPPPEDFDASLTSYLAILLTATDSTGLSSTTSVIVKPKTVSVFFDSKPSGLHIVANGDKFKTPATITTWENHKFLIEAPSQTMHGSSYGFKSWSDGDKKRHEYVVPTKNPEPLIAEFTKLKPVPQIQSPASGTTFAVDDKLKLIGSATDGAGNTLPDSSLTWEIRYRSTKHAKHSHFLEPTRGNHIEINGRLKPEDLKTAKDTYLEILLIATDPAGLTAKTSLILEPRRVDVNFSTNPPGLDLVLDGETFMTPITITSWENHKFNIRASPQTIDGAKYNFAQWSDGGKRSHKYKTPARKDAVVADFDLSLPIPEISIAEGTKFAVGDKIKLVGFAEDSDGNALPDSSLTWEASVFDKEYDSYRTVLKPTRGNNIEFDAPQPTDFDEAESSHLEILLTATDAAGHSSTRSFVMKPKLVDIVFETNPYGFHVMLGGKQYKTPITITTWEKHTFLVEVPPQKKRDTTYYWNSWSDGGASSHEFVVGAKTRRGPAIVVANLGESQPKTDSSEKTFLFMGIGIGVAVLSLIVLGVWLKLRLKRRNTLIEMNDTSSHADDFDKIDEGVVASVDESTLHENASQEGIEATDNFDVEGPSASVSESSTNC